MYVRNQADGKLTGLALEFSQFRLARRFSDLASEQQAEQQLHEFFSQAARWGITTVQNMSNPITAERCLALFEKAPPPVRVRVMWFGLTDEHGRLTGEGSDLPVHSAPSKMKALLGHFTPMRQLQTRVRVHNQKHTLLASRPERFPQKKFCTS